MSYATLDTHGKVSVVTLNRPERLNAIGEELLRDLHQRLSDAQADPATRAIVFTGAGRAFCAGADLKAHSGVSLSGPIQQITRDIMFGPKLVIGAIHGHAVGGGLEWMLNCDLVVAADILVAFFPEMALGHFVTGGATHLLPKAVGHQRAMELFVLGEKLDAATLHGLGLVNRVVPAGEVMATALAWADQVAERSPLATSLLKRALTGETSSHLETALDHEQEAAARCAADPDTARRIAGFASRKA